MATPEGLDARLGVCTSDGFYFQNDPKGGAIAMPNGLHDLVALCFGGVVSTSSVESAPGGPRSFG